MPRPKRDYRLSIQQDLTKLDEKIRELLSERARKLQMIEVLNAPLAKIDISAVLGSPAAKRGRPRKQKN